MDKKGNKGIIIALCTVIVVLICAITYGFVSGTVSFNTNKNNTNDKIEENNNDNSNKLEDNNEQDNDVVREVDLTKCLNNSGNSYSDATDVDSNTMFSLKINSDKKSVTFSINWEKFGPFSGASMWTNTVGDYQITGFSKEIKEVFIGGVGQSVQGTTLFYLMEDGTVEYTPIFVLKTDSQNNKYYEMNYKYDISSDGKYSNQRFEIEGTIIDVKDVIKLYSVSACAGVNGSCWVTVIGALNDGSFYDLGDIIEKQ